jgi:hypothetical protein
MTFCRACNGQCCRVESTGHRVGHMGAMAYTHVCESCQDGKPSVWTFDPRLSGSRRSDGVYFFATTNSSGKEIWDGSFPDWAWEVHWSDPFQRPVLIDPVKRNLPSPADVEQYIDSKWPIRP